MWKSKEIDRIDRVELIANRALLNPHFQNYKVVMQGPDVRRTDLTSRGAVPKRPASMFSLQHMKIFSNANLLFINDINLLHRSDGLVEDDGRVYLYRFCANTTIEEMIYSKNEGDPNRRWTFHTVADFELPADNAYPPSIFFVDQEMAVVCNGVDLVVVYSICRSEKYGKSVWTKAFEYRVPTTSSVYLIEARNSVRGLELLLQQIEEHPRKEAGEAYRTRIFYVTINPDISGRAIRVREFIQEGFFETCSIGPESTILFVSTRPPVYDNDSLNPRPERTWTQTGREIVVTFRFSESLADVSYRLRSIDEDSISIKVKEWELLDGVLGGKIDPESCSLSGENNELVLKMLAAEDGQWDVLLASERGKRGQLQEHLGLGMPHPGSSSQMEVGPEEMESCDEDGEKLNFYWFSLLLKEIEKETDASRHQVLFVRHWGNKSADICFRHEVDGMIWDMSIIPPKHIATLQAFGYVQASKNLRTWSGAPPDHSYACILESNNHAFIYWQKVPVQGNLVNRWQPAVVSHVAKQQVLQLRTSLNTQVNGAFADNTLTFFLAEDCVLVANYLEGPHD